MNIEFTKKEYKDLLEIIEIAYWVLFAHRTGERPQELKKYENLEQIIYGYAKELGYDNLIMYDEEFERYFATREFEETSPSLKYIEEYDNEAFWGKLIERLAIRDFYKKYNKKTIKKMSKEERFKKIDEISEKYSEEFVSNGLDNLILN